MRPDVRDRDGSERLIDPARWRSDHHRMALAELVRRQEVVELAHQATPHTLIAARAYTSAVFARPSISRFSPFTVSRSPLEVP